MVNFSPIWTKEDPTLATSVDRLKFALSHVEAGILRIDEEGRIWRTYLKSHEEWILLKNERRAENEGSKGYLRVSIGIPFLGKNCITMAHKLVYCYFNNKLIDYESDETINHKDLNKQNNHPDNLEVVSNLENMQHSYKSGTRIMPWKHKREDEENSTWRGKKLITESQKEEAREMRKNGYLFREIAEFLNCHIGYAQFICRKVI